MLIASVLSKATCELQAQGLSSTDATSIISEEANADWQAVWAYALGSELELSSLLRSDKNFSKCPRWLSLWCKVLQHAFFL